MVEFVDNVPWLWTACWRENYLAMYGMMSGGESMMMGTESVFFAETAKAVTLEKEPALDEQIANAKDLIEFLERIRQEEDVQEAIDEKQWLQFTESIYDWLYDLEAVVDDNYSY